MVRSVETRTFKHNAHREEYLSKLKLPAFRALFQDRIVEMLTTIELDTAILAAIGIDGHSCPSR